MKVSVVRNAVVTVTLSEEEATVLRSVTGLAGYTTERCGQEYEWNENDREKVKAVLLDLYWQLTSADVAVYHDRRERRDR